MPASSRASSLRCSLAVLVTLAGLSPLTARDAPDPAADALLAAARRAYNEKIYPAARDRFREFLGKYAGHKEAPSASYGLALALVEGPDRDYAAAAEQLQKLAGDKDFPDHPQVLYYLGLSRRALGVKELSLAASKPQEADRRKHAARQHFEEAARQFGAAVETFSARVKGPGPDAKELPADLEWAARARCDGAEVLLRLLRPKEAREAVTPLVNDKVLQGSRYRGLALYYHGFASFQLKDDLAAGRSLGQLVPFDDPVFGTHARYLLARVHHAEGERQEAAAHYEGVLAGHAARKKAAAEALKQPDRFKNDPEEKARLEELVRGSEPDHVARAAFFLGLLQYEDGKFSDALTRLVEFAKAHPKSPLAAEALLRQGACHVQLKQYAEAIKVLQPLADREPRLADQCLLWIGKARVGAADPKNATAYEQALKSGIEAFRKAAERAVALAERDPDAKARRGEILVELADTQQLARQFKEAADTYNQILKEKLLPGREDEIELSRATALQLAGDYAASDEACKRFRDAHPKSPLLPAVLFRHAENAYFSGQTAEKDPAARDRWADEAVQRYQVVVEKYPEFTLVNLALQGLGMGYYRKGDLEKAREYLEAIPPAERTGDLALVPYQLADILIRTAPATADDAVSAGKLEEQMKGASELLQAFVAVVPSGPQTPDALLKLGHCQQRLAALLAQPKDQANALQAARAAYERILGKFPGHELRPQAAFERAKCLALAKDVNGAVNELRKFTQDPLRATPVAPMAVLSLATLLRGQNQAAAAADALKQCRQQHEPKLQQDPARAGWVTLLLYHHGVALREAGKRAEAKALFDQVVKQTPDQPEAWEAGLRAGQCLKDDGRQKIAEGAKRLANPKPEEAAAARKQIDEGLADVRESVRLLVAQAEALKQQKPAGDDLERQLAEARARMLYEAAWGQRAIAEQEVAAAREQVKQELWQKRRNAVAKKSPPGQKPPPVPAPDVPPAAVPEPPAEQEARAQYQALIDGYPDLPLNADARFELAELLADRGLHDAAITLLKQALDKEPSPELTDKVKVRLGAALVAKGAAKAALAHVLPITRNPRSAMAPHATYLAGECSLQQNDPDGAVKHLSLFRDRGAFQNVPGVTDRALLRLGETLFQLKQWDASRQAYEQVVIRFGNGPWAPESRYGVGRAWQNLGQHDNAVNAYTQVVQTDGSERGARAQLGIGQCRLAQKRYADAVNALLLVPVAYDYPELSAQALLEAAKAHELNKQEDQAVQLLRRIVQEYPGTESAAAAKKRLEEWKKG
jgi:TolA-binding protein